MKRTIFGFVGVMLVIGLVMTGCGDPSDPLGDSGARNAIVWNGDSDIAKKVDVEAVRNDTRKNASGPKITSNAHSAAFPGILFRWDQKQKDDGYLKVKADLFGEGAYESFTLTAKMSSEYWDFPIAVQPGQDQTADGCYVFFIPKAAGNGKNINMVFVSDFIRDAAETCDGCNRDLGEGEDQDTDKCDTDGCDEYDCPTDNHKKCGKDGNCKSCKCTCCKDCDKAEPCPKDEERCGDSECICPCKLADKGNELYGASDITKTGWQPRVDLDKDTLENGGIQKIYMINWNNGTNTVNPPVLGMAYLKLIGGKLVLYIDADVVRNGNANVGSFVQSNTKGLTGGKWENELQNSLNVYKIDYNANLSYFYLNTKGLKYFTPVIEPAPKAIVDMK